MYLDLSINIDVHVRVTTPNTKLDDKHEHHMRQVWHSK